MTDPIGELLEDILDMVSTVFKTFVFVTGIVVVIAVLVIFMV